MYTLYIYILYYMTNVYLLLFDHVIHDIYYIYHHESVWPLYMWGASIFGYLSCCLLLIEVLCACIYRVGGWGGEGSEGGRERRGEGSGGGEGEEGGGGRGAEAVYMSALFIHP